MAAESSSAIYQGPTDLSNEISRSSRGSVSRGSVSRGSVVRSMKRKLSTFFSPTSPPKMVLGVASEEEADFSMSDEDEVEPTRSSLPPQPLPLVPPSLHRVRSGVVNCSQTDSSPAAPRRIRSGASNTAASGNSESSSGPTRRGRSGVVNCSPPGSSSSQRLRSGVVNCSDAAPSSQRVRSGVANCCGAEVTANLLGARPGKHISLAHSDLHGSAAVAAVAHLLAESHPKMSLPADFSPASVLLARRTNSHSYGSDDEDGSAVVHPESAQSDVSSCEGVDGDSVSGDECAGESPSPVVSRESSSGEVNETIHVKGSSCSNLPDHLTEDIDWRGSGSSNLSETCLPLHTRRPTPATLFVAEQDFRKLSDPAASLRREWVRDCRSGRKQRCLSEGEAPNLSRTMTANCEDDEFRSEEGGSSAQGYDSGYHDDVRSKAQDSVWSHSPALSESDGGHEYGRTSRARKTTPFPQKQPELEMDTPLAVTQRAKRSLTRSSVGGTSSLGASSESHSYSQSQSMSSLWDCQSPETVTDILSSLGFDDFESPQLIPDRFIPKEVEQAKPSVMKLEAFLPTVPFSQDSVDIEPIEPAEPVEAFQIPIKSREPLDLPLGATAETFLSHKRTRSTSPPPPLQPPTSPQPPPPKPIPSDPSPLYNLHSTLVYTDQNLTHFYRSKAALEPVPEETASDLSPSPRWFSPRVSIDHSVADIADKLGANLAAKARKRSLPQRDGYKLSLGSQVESEPDSIYFSVTSYDDEVAREKEREKEEVSVPLPFPTEDFAQRRRRRGVYTPPPGLMNWLSAQQPISEEDCQDLDPNELPWPFNEEVRLRKSLSEIQQAQQSSFGELTCTDDSQSSRSSPDNDNGQTQRRRSRSSPGEAAAPSSPSRVPSSPLRHPSPDPDVPLDSTTAADEVPPQSPNMEVSTNSNSSNNNEDSKASPKHQGLLHSDRIDSHREPDSRHLPSSVSRHTELALTGHELLVSLASPEQQMCRELDSYRGHLRRLPEVAASS